MGAGSAAFDCELTNLLTVKNISEYFPVTGSTIGGSDLCLGLDRVPVPLNRSTARPRLGGAEAALLVSPVLPVHVD